MPDQERIQDEVDQLLHRVVAGLVKQRDFLKEGK